MSYLTSLPASFRDAEVLKEIDRRNGGDRVSQNRVKPMTQKATIAMLREQGNRLRARNRNLQEQIHHLVQTPWIWTNHRITFHGKNKYGPPDGQKATRFNGDIKPPKRIMARGSKCNGKRRGIEIIESVYKRRDEPTDKGRWHYDWVPEESG